MNEVIALMIGRSAQLPDGKRSAIGKHPVLGPVHIGTLGLAGDMQVDKRHHGGPEMACISILWRIMHFGASSLATIPCSAAPARSAAILPSRGWTRPRSA